MAKVKRRQGFAGRRREGQSVTFAQVLTVGVGCVLAAAGVLLSEAGR